MLQIQEAKDQVYSYLFILCLIKTLYAPPTATLHVFVLSRVSTSIVSLIIIQGHQIGTSSRDNKERNTLLSMNTPIVYHIIGQRKKVHRVSSQQQGMVTTQYYIMVCIMIGKLLYTSMVIQSHKGYTTQSKERSLIGTYILICLSSLGILLSLVSRYLQTQKNRVIVLPGL